MTPEQQQARVGAAYEAAVASTLSFDVMAVKKLIEVVLAAADEVVPVVARAETDTLRSLLEGAQIEATRNAHERDEARAEVERLTAVLKHD